MLQAEKDILSKYNLEYIKNSIYQRKLSIEVNTIDYISLLFRLDEWRTGYKELKNLIDNGFQFYNLYFYLGLFYLKEKKFEKALEYFIKTIELIEQHGAALNNAGAILLLFNEKSKAQEYFDKALKYYPTYMDASNNYKLLRKSQLKFNDLSITWRELREVLTSYSG